MSEPLVSASWHRVAALRPGLVPGLRVVRQPVREQVWHVLVEPATGRQVRLNPSAYALVARFDGQVSVSELWERQLAQQRADAPTQDEVLRLLAQLFRGGMLRFDAAPHLSLVFARRDEEGRQRRRTFMNPLMLRMPLADPTRLLRLLAPLGALLFRRATFIAWLLAALLAALAAGAHFQELVTETRRLFGTPSNYLIAWFCYPVVKLLHELAHGLAVRRFGGEVHEMGVTLMFLTPAPYVDASAANAFADPRQRLVVSAAGILVEIALACAALALWLAASPGLVRDVALVVVLICSVSTLMFNANPLMRLDGYYVLCDALQLPNLALRSRAWWARHWRRWIGAAPGGPEPLLAHGERKWLLAYAPASALYRVVLLLTLVFWVGQYSWLLGSLGAAALLFWLLKVTWQWATGAAAASADPRLRWRSLRAAAAVGTLAVLVLAVVPAPHQVVARGVVWPPENAQLRAASGGFVERVQLEQGAAAQAGQSLLLLSDPVLVAQRERVLAERGGLLTQQYGALLSEPARATELAEDVERNAAEIARLDEQLAQLEVRALVAGQVVWARPQDLPGSYVQRGAMLGHVLAPGPAHVRVALLEEDFLRTRGRVQAVEVRMADAPFTAYAAKLSNTVPGAALELPSAALGDRYGGPVPVDPADPNGVRTRAPVFVLDAAVPALRPPAVGGRAWVKLVLPPEPLAQQWMARLRQLFLKQFNPMGQA
ncbi:MAG: PqqD family peptide modification chaperone [Ramlibacter sp.]